MILPECGHKKHEASKSAPVGFGLSMVQIWELIYSIIIGAGSSTTFLPTPYALSGANDLTLPVDDRSEGDLPLLIEAMESHFFHSLLKLSKLTPVTKHMRCRFEQGHTCFIHLKREGGSYLLCNHNKK